MILERTPHEEPDSEPQRQLLTASWGLLPAWAKDRKMASKLINARSETVTEIICPCQLRDSDFAPFELRVMRC